MKINLFGVVLGFILSIQAQSSNQRDGGSQILSSPYIQQQRELRYLDFIKKLETNPVNEWESENFQNKLAKIFLNLGLRFESGEIQDPVILGVLAKLFPEAKAEENVMSYLKKMRFVPPEIIFDPQDVPVKDGISYCYQNGDKFEEVSSIREDWDSPICISIQLASIDFFRSDEQWLAIIVNDVAEKFSGIDDKNGSEALQEYVLMNINELLDLELDYHFVYRSKFHHDKKFEFSLDPQCKENIIYKVKLRNNDGKPIDFPLEITWYIEYYQSTSEGRYYSDYLENTYRKLRFDSIEQVEEFGFEVGNDRYLRIYSPVLIKGPSSITADFEWLHCGKTILSKEDYPSIAFGHNKKIGQYLGSIHLGKGSIFPFGQNILPDNNLTKYFDFSNWLEDTSPY
ncbi:MAG: hypothetical protein VX642_00925 [Bdellovibrionota bacterium]|nr:hypothetical protein [Bdellovibrionota bacterium]